MNEYLQAALGFFAFCVALRQHLNQPTNNYKNENQRSEV